MKKQTKYTISKILFWAGIIVIIVSNIWLFSQKNIEAAPGFSSGDRSFWMKPVFDTNMFAFRNIISAVAIIIGFLWGKVRK